MGKKRTCLRDRKPGEPLYVYLLCTPDNKCKIGHSTKPARRLKDLQRSCPILLQFKHLILTRLALRLEVFLQWHFHAQGKRIWGEWFQLTDQDFRDIANKWPSENVTEFNSVPVTDRDIPFKWKKEDK